MRNHQHISIVYSTSFLVMNYGKNQT